MVLFTPISKVTKSNLLKGFTSSISDFKIDVDQPERAIIYNKKSSFEKLLCKLAFSCSGKRQVAHSPVPIV